MQQHMRMAAAIFTISLAAVFETVQASRAADDCLAKPNATAPQGSHWYYRVDRTTHRQCWFLGPEVGKLRPHARQGASPVRPRPSKVSAQPAPQAPAQAITSEATGDGPLPAKALPVEITLGQAKPPEDDSTAGVAPWLAIPTSTLAIPPGLVSMRDNYAEERSPTDSEDEMPLIWPILSPAELSAAERPPQSPTSFAQICAALAVALGLAAMIGRLIFKLSASGRPSRSHSGRRPILAAGAHRRDKHAPPTFAHTTAAARQARMTGRAGKAPSPPSGSGADIESSVRRLLHELERRRPAQQRRASKRTLWKVAA
jgi:hypothetical protein